MPYFKARIFALLIILVSIGLVYYNWHQVLQEGRYSLKLAALGPVGIVGGLYLLIFDGSRLFREMKVINIAYNRTVHSPRLNNDTATSCRCFFCRNFCCGENYAEGA